MDLDGPSSTLDLDLDIGTMELQDRSHEIPMDWQRTPHANRAAPSQAKKRPHSVLNSPVKSTPLQLRDPNSQPFLFAKPDPPRKPTLASTLQGLSFTTPRKMGIELDFSSGVDSPEGAADSEATPPQIHSVRKTSHFKIHSPETQARSQPIFGGQQSHGTPHNPRHYSNAVTKRVNRRRKDELFRTAIRDKTTRTEESASEQEPRSPRSSRKPLASPSPADQSPLFTPLAPSNIVARFFDYLHSRPNLPQLLLGFLQLATNVIFVSFLFYVLYAAYSTITLDIDNRVREFAAEQLAENAACLREYQANSCDIASARVPAMHNICDSWEKCYKRDPLLAGRAKMGSRTLAEIFNGFVEPISLKTMIFGPAVFVITWFTLNAFLMGAKKWNSSASAAASGAGMQYHQGLPMGIGGGYGSQGALPPPSHLFYPPGLPPYQLSSQKEQMYVPAGFEWSGDHSAVTSGFVPPGLSFTPKSRGASVEERPGLGHSMTVPAKFPTRGDDSPRKIGFR